MVNVGTTPPDYSAPTGQFRLLAQDTSYVDLSPSVVGQGSFELFSDAEISGYLAMYEGYSLYRPVAAAYLGLAGRAALQAKMVKDYDLQVDLTKRASLLQAQAEAFMERAEREDQLTGATSGFGLTVPAGDFADELMNRMPYVWGLSPIDHAINAPFLPGFDDGVVAVSDGVAPAEVGFDGEGPYVDGVLFDLDGPYVEGP